MLVFIKLLIILNSFLLTCSTILLVIGAVLVLFAGTITVILWAIPLFLITGFINALIFRNK